MSSEWNVWRVIGESKNRRPNVIDVCTRIDCFIKYFYNVRLMIVKWLNGERVTCKTRIMKLWNELIMTCSEWIDNDKWWLHLMILVEPTSFRVHVAFVRFPNLNTDTRAARPHKNKYKKVNTTLNPYGRCGIFVKVTKFNSNRRKLYLSYVTVNTDNVLFMCIFLDPLKNRACTNSSKNFPYETKSTYISFILAKFLLW